MMEINDSVILDIVIQLGEVSYLGLLNMAGGSEKADDLNIIIDDLIDRRKIKKSGHSDTDPSYMPVQEFVIYSAGDYRTAVYSTEFELARDTEYYRQLNADSPNHIDGLVTWHFMQSVRKMHVKYTDLYCKLDGVTNSNINGVVSPTVRISENGELVPINCSLRDNYIGLPNYTYYSDFIIGTEARSEIEREYRRHLLPLKYQHYVGVLPLLYDWSTTTYIVSTALVVLLHNNTDIIWLTSALQWEDTSVYLSGQGDLYLKLANTVWYYIRPDGRMVKMAPSAAVIDLFQIANGIEYAKDIVNNNDLARISESTGKIEEVSTAVDHRALFPAFDKFNDTLSLKEYGPFSENFED